MDALLLAAAAPAGSAAAAVPVVLVSTGRGPLRRDRPASCSSSSESDVRKQLGRLPERLSLSDSSSVLRLLQGW
jgi:hypothetical protein